VVGGDRGCGVTQVQCPVCNLVCDKRSGAVNRSINRGMAVYCGRKCAGIGRRENRSMDEKKAIKRYYDAIRRIEKADTLRVTRAEYHRRTYDPIKAAEKRKERMPKHVEYCRQPEYRKWKAEYDRIYRAKQEAGDFYESYLLVLEIRQACLALAPDIDIRRAAGTLNKHQNRRRDYDRSYSNKPEAGALGYT
jgi:hypothetical protein